MDGGVTAERRAIFLNKGPASTTKAAEGTTLSRGQEPYSLAMVLREFFPDLAGWTVRVIATDLSAEMVEKAREGRYTQLEVNRGVPSRLLVKYFRRQGMMCQVCDEIRALVEFRQLNCVKGGDILVTGMVMHPTGLSECLTKAARAINWGRKDPPSAPHKRRGKGVAIMWKAPAMPPNAGSSARVSLAEDGTANDAGSNREACET